MCDSGPIYVKICIGESGSGTGLIGELWLPSVTVIPTMLLTHSHHNAGYQKDKRAETGHIKKATIFGISETDRQKVLSLLLCITN